MKPWEYRKAQREPSDNIGYPPLCGEGQAPGDKADYPQPPRPKGPPPMRETPPMPADIRAAHDRGEPVQYSEARARWEVYRARVPLGEQDPEIAEIVEKHYLPAFRARPAQSRAARAAKEQAA